MVDASCALEYNVSSIVQLCYININSTLSFDTAVQIFCIFADFCPLVISIIERIVLKSSITAVNLYVSLSVLSFLLNGF